MMHLPLTDPDCLDRGNCGRDKYAPSICSEPARVLSLVSQWYPEASQTLPGNGNTCTKDSGPFVRPLGRSWQGSGHLSNTTCLRGKSSSIYVSLRRGIRDRRPRPWMGCVGSLGATADAATNSPVTLGEFLFLPSSPPGPQYP